MLLKQEIRNFLHFSFGEKKTNVKIKKTKTNQHRNSNLTLLNKKYILPFQMHHFCLYSFSISSFTYYHLYHGILSIGNSYLSFIVACAGNIVVAVFFYNMLKYTGLVKLQLAMKFKLHAHFLFRYQLNKIRKTTKC